MKKKISKNSLAKQPVLKNVSLIGTTMMISSSVLIPGVTTKAYAETTKEAIEASENKANKIENQAMDLQSFTTADVVKEEANLFEMSLVLNAHQIENLNTTIQVSPNINLELDPTKTEVKDELGNIIGHYELDKQLNQIKVVFTGKGFTQAKLVVPSSLKKFDLLEQVITVSIGESMLSQSVMTERQEITEETVKTEETTKTEELTEETTKTEESSKEESTESTKESTEESSVETSETKEATIESKTEETKNSTTSTSKEVESTEISKTEESTDTETTQETSTKESTEESIEESTEESSKEESTDDIVEEAPQSVQMMSAPLMMGPRTLRSATPQAQFIEDTAYHAQQVAGANNLYASVMIAQAILESGYGSSTLSAPPNHNLFGIKGSYNGQSTTMQTWEHFNGRDVTINAQFRKYPSYRESFEDNARVLKTTSFSPGNYFYSGAWKSNTNTYQDATRWLTGRYATDPNYNVKLNNLIVTHNLTQYDGPGNNNSGNNNTTNDKTNNNNNNNSGNNNNNANKGQNYTVKSGDTLYGIAINNGVSVAQIKQWNNLSSDMIYVGQVLKVTASGSTIGGGNSNNNNKPKEEKPTSNNSTKHTVKSGDTLTAIANKYGVSVAQLKSWNNLTSDMIYVGQTLVLKGGNNVSTANNNNTTKPVSQGNKHTVKSGDTLYGIANQYGVSVGQIKQWNNLSNDIIYVGQSLVLKGGSGTNTTQPPVTTPTGKSKQHTVKSGDTLYGIASQYGVSVTQIKQWNNLNNDIIYVGQKLAIGSQGSSSQSQGQGSQNVSNSAKNHIVKSGDTLYGISLRYGVSVNEIKQKNNLKSDMIYIGQQLTISGSATNQSSSQPTRTENSSAYKVKSGDSLYQIAVKHGVSVTELKQENGLKGDMIYVGQSLKIPGKTAVSTTQNVGNTKRHQIKSGDSLWSLSTKYKTSVSQIKIWNNLTSDIIYSGQNLRVG